MKWILLIQIISYLFQKNGIFKSLIYNKYFIPCLVVVGEEREKKKKEEKGNGKSKLFSIHVFGYKKKRKKKKG